MQPDKFASATTARAVIGHFDGATQHQQLPSVTLIRILSTSRLQISTDYAEPALRSIIPPLFVLILWEMKSIRLSLFMHTFFRSIKLGEIGFIRIHYRSISPIN